MTVKVVTDSTSDLGPELAQQLGVSIVPVYLHFGEETYRDGVDMGADEFYRRLESSPVHPTTSAPSPGDFTEVYAKLAQQTDEVICILIGSRVSGTYNAALQGREAFGEMKCRIEIVDSGLVTMPLGLVVMAAAEAAGAGQSLARVLDEVNGCIARIRMLALFDTLRYLLLGGRISKAKAIVGAALSVKPLITMRDGELVQAGVVRSRSRGVDRLHQLVKGVASVQDVAIVHSTTPDEAASFKERISSMIPEERIRIARLGPALGVHGGPGSLIVAVKEGEGR